MARMQSPGAAGEVQRMRESYGGRNGGASAAAIARLLAGVRGLRTTSGPLPTPLELVAPPESTPRVAPAESLEPAKTVAIPVPGEPEPGVAAFLDGIQRSVVVGHLGGTIPIVHGLVAAVVRERVDRTLTTWGGGAVIRAAIVAPEGRASTDERAALRALPLDLVDTSDAASGGDHTHPLEFLARARVEVQRRREAAEASLAEAWCAAESRPVYIDGGIGAFGAAARSPLAVGVVKSHHTIYAAAGGLALIAGLRPGERTPAFTVATRQRTAVASWYLRLHSADGAPDPLAGVVRIEVAADGFEPARADEVSRWVLAEREPVALPDPRWRAMAYGIRDCEEYLRAVAG